MMKRTNLKALEKEVMTDVDDLFVMSHMRTVVEGLGLNLNLEYFERIELSACS